MPHELDAWRADVRHMTEAERHLAYEEPRAAIGLVGDREDARYG
jgi:hypothetical protein